MVGEDRVSVDDALISTDVDKLIRTISTKKRVNIYELEKETGIHKKTIDKWIHVLEDEGYIKIEYKFTNTYVVWLGAVPTNSHEEEVEYVIEESDSPFKTDMKSEIEVTTPTEVPEVKVVSVEEPIVEKTNGKEETPTLEEPKEEIYEKVKPNFEQIKERVFAYTPKETAEKKRIKEVVNGYLDEINRQKTEIEKLKQEKEKIYRNRYMTLENKIEGDIVAITERVLEKEGRILELKERVLELPDKVDEVEKLHKTMERIEKEGRSIIKATKGKVSDFLDHLRKSEETINEGIREGNETVESEKIKVTQLEQISISINERVDGIKLTIDQTQNAIDQLTESMKDMLNQLEEATETKVEIAEITNRVRVSVDKKEQELEALENELSEIKKLEQWIMEYLNDYENKVGEIEQYVKNSDEELDKIREAAEGEYIRKYLRELEGLTSMYETELDYAVAEEKGVEERIGEAKVRLNELILDSKTMIKKLHKESASLEEFEPVVRKVRDKADKTKKTVEEKEKERDRLSEDIRGRKDKKKTKAKDKKGKKK